MGPNEALMAQLGRNVEDFVLAAAVEFSVTMAELNNRGGGSALPAPIDTGELRGSLRVTVNTPSVDESDPEGGPYDLLTAAEVRKTLQVAGLQVGDVIWFRWVAKHANIIEGGRRPDRNGRMIGSEQAVEGWVIGDAVEALTHLDTWEYMGKSYAA